mmetsp:Transcript_23587/g.41804  ORF Transcript_23587/g.41804 Transcript_23587/m.41804 type:complete len:375 (-) Transcript_23587:1494-2618(-)
MSKFTRDVDRITKALGQSRTVIKQTITDFICLLQRFIDHYSNEVDEEVYRQEVRMLYEQLQSNKPLRAVAEEHRGVYRHISRLHKDIKSTFTQNPEDCKCHDSTQLDREKLRHVVDEHLVREGCFEESEEFEDAFGIQAFTEETLAAYRGMFTEIERISSGDIAEAISWAEDNWKLLEDNGSLMRFKLYCLRTIRLIKNGDQLGATEFLRSHIDEQSFQQSELIQRLSTLCIFPNSYPELLTAEYEHELVQSILKEGYGILKQPALSPLSVIAAKGDFTLPSYIALSKVMPDNVWTTPAPLETADMNTEFHSILVCPISHDIANNDNPAMLQPCGHWATRNALLKLIKSSRDGRIKCHICPQTFNEADLKLLIV